MKVLFVPPEEEHEQSQVQNAPLKTWDADGRKQSHERKGAFALATSSWADRLFLTLAI